MSKAATLDPNPPRVQMAFRVGVAGHRWERLGAADPKRLAEVLGEILSTVQRAVIRYKIENADWYANKEPALRAVSSLAEGSDRLFAVAALELGFELACPLPFAKDEFEQDFSRSTDPDSLAEFRRLLGRADGGVFALDGSRSREVDAYEAAANMILDHSDLLVVVWDGHQRGARAGAEWTFAAARLRRMPMLWIDAHAPHDYTLVDGSESFEPSDGAPLRPKVSATQQEIEETVFHVLKVPKHGLATNTKDEGDQPDLEDPVSMGSFYAETRERFTPGVWRWFCQVVGGATAEQKTPASRTKPEESAGVQAYLSRAAEYYDWPNRLAVHYSSWYRTAFLLTYLFAALAVGAALFPFALGWMKEVPAGQRGAELGETLFAVAEFVLLSFVLSLVGIGQKNLWHERWMSYRIAAELLRPLGLLGLVGGRRKLPVHHHHLASYVAPARTWMVWYLRSVERLLSLPTVQVNDVHLEQCLSVLEATLNEQIDYHAANAERYERLEHRMHRFGIALLAISLVACALHVLPHVLDRELPHFVTPVLVFLGGFCPALGAATAGISNQAEFVRVAKRSAAMERQLGKLLLEVPRIRTAIGSGGASGLVSDRIAQLTASVAETMVHEVLDWRVVLLDRPLTPPG